MKFTFGRVFDEARRAFRFAISPAKYDGSSIEKIVCDEFNVTLDTATLSYENAWVKYGWFTDSRGNRMRGYVTCKDGDSGAFAVLFPEAKPKRGQYQWPLGRRR